MANSQHSNAPAGRAIPDPVLERIEQLQAIQRKNPPSSAAWQRASDELAPLFAQMALRQAVAVLSTAHVEVRNADGAVEWTGPLHEFADANGFDRAELCIALRDGSTVVGGGAAPEFHVELVGGAS